MVGERDIPGFQYVRTWFERGRTEGLLHLGDVFDKVVGVVGLAAGGAFVGIGDFFHSWVLFALYLLIHLEFLRYHHTRRQTFRLLRQRLINILPVHLRQCHHLLQTPNQHLFFLFLVLLIYHKSRFLRKPRVLENSQKFFHGHGDLYGTFF